MATEKEREEHLEFAEWYAAQFGKRPQPVLDDEELWKEMIRLERLCKEKELLYRRCEDYDNRRDACMKAWYAKRGQK